LIVGPDHKKLVPASLSLGMAFMMIIDDVARTLLPGEIPLGILTGLIGVPILVLLMRRSKMGW
jgi:iron complex transport system permease protein